MSRGIVRKAHQKWVLLLGLIALGGLGCSPSTLWFLMRGDDKKDPTIPLPAKEGKKEVTVVILPSASPTMSMDPAFAGAERELAGLISSHMMSETKDDRRPIKVIEQSKVDKLKSTPGQDWRTMNPATIGKKLGADYVIDLTLTTMGIYQPEYGREFYQGRANLSVVVYDTDKPDSPYQDYLHSAFGDQKSTAVVSPAGYRKYFMNKVAVEVTHRHTPHVAVRELPPVQ